MGIKIRKSLKIGQGDYKNWTQEEDYKIAKLQNYKIRLQNYNPASGTGITRFVYCTPSECGYVWFIQVL